MAGYGGSAFIFFGLLFLLNELVLITAMPPAPPDHTQLFATMDKEFELLSLSEFLPRKLSAVCMRLANSFCLPIAGMITLVLALASIFTDCLRDWSREHGFSNVDGSWEHRLFFSKQVWSLQLAHDNCTQGNGCSQCPEILLSDPGRRGVNVPS